MNEDCKDDVTINELKDANTSVSTIFAIIIQLQKDQDLKTIENQVEF